MKKIVILILIFVGGALLLSSRSQPTVLSKITQNPDLILFWGSGCSHCENVKKYISDNNIASKISISQKEVYSDQNNQNELQQTVLKCPNINTSEGIGVPLVYLVSENKCLQGDQPIIDWLTNKLKWTVSKKHHPSSFKFTLAHFLRLAVFFIILYLSITYLSSQSPITIPNITDPTVLGEETVNSVYHFLPQDSQKYLENLKQNDVIIYLQDKYKYFKDQSQDFPNRQIKEIKKAVIDTIYRDLINNLENKKWAKLLS